jgi:hypothetical protein
MKPNKNAKVLFHPSYECNSTANKNFHNLVVYLITEHGSDETYRILEYYIKQVKRIRMDEIKEKLKTGSEA